MSTRHPIFALEAELQAAIDTYSAAVGAAKEAARKALSEVQARHAVVARKLLIPADAVRS